MTKEGRGRGRREGRQEEGKKGRVREGGDPCVSLNFPWNNLCS